MLQKFFTNYQLSFFFRIAIFMQLLSLIGNLIVYHYFPNHTLIHNLLQFLNELSLFTICLIIISQVLRLLIKKNKNFIYRYKFISLHIGIVISMFLFWLLATDNDIQEEFIIFLSKISLTDYNYELTIILLVIFIALLIDFYYAIKEPEMINEKTIPEIVKSSFRLVIKEHLFIFISIFGVLHIKKIYEFSSNLLHYVQTSILTDFIFLEILIAMSWFITLLYYLYNHFYNKKSLLIRK